MFKHQTLENGLQLVVAPAPGTEAATVLVLIKTGSRYEERDMAGAAHFIEHMMFKGTVRHPEALDLSKTIEQYGADYNAYTTKDHTGYYVKMAGSNFSVGIDLVHDMLANSVFAAEEMEKERGVIIEEIRMYEDNPRMHLGDLLDAALYGDTPLGWNTAGDDKTMRTMTREQVLAYRDMYYVPERVTVVLAGAVRDEHVALAQKLFGGMQRGTVPAREFMPAPEIPARVKPSVRLQKKETGQIQLAIAYPGLPLDHVDVPAMKLMSSILGGGMSSRLFIAVREKQGLAYSVGCGTASYEDAGHFAITAGLAKKEYTKACTTILQEVERMVKHGVTEEELAHAKTRVEGGLLLALEDSSDRAEWYANQILMKGRAKTPNERLKDFLSVTREDVQRVAGTLFDAKKMSIAAIGPFVDEADVLKPFVG